MADANTDLTPEQLRELAFVKAHNQHNGRAQNPFVAVGRDGTATIGFRVCNNDSEPLWWTGSGFKNLARVNANAEYFPTSEQALAKIRTEILNYIPRFRYDQAHLVYGWS